MTKRTHHKLIALWVFLLGLSGWLRLSAADSVILHFANGDRLSGTVISENPSEVVINAGLLGKITVPLSQISKRKV